MYRIVFDPSRRFKKDLSILKKNIQVFRYVERKLDEFAIDPFAKKWNVRKMEPKSDNLLRLRLDKIRVIFDIDTGNKVIVVYRMGYRKDVYK